MPDFYGAATLSEFQDRVHSLRPVRRTVRNDCALEELPRQAFEERRLWSGSLGIFLGQDGLLLHRGARVFAFDSGQNRCDVSGWTPAERAGSRTGGSGRILESIEETIRRARDLAHRVETLHAIAPKLRAKR